jgi:hypothetical protein
VGTSQRLISNHYRYRDELESMKHFEFQALV